MAAWLIPALKAVLPHVGTIISAAAPVFTRNKPDAATPPSELMQKQIGELQTAAAQNAAHVKDLAAQLQTTVAALEEMADTVDRRLRNLRLACMAAIVMSLLALLVTLVAMLVAG